MFYIHCPYWWRRADGLRKSFTAWARPISSARKIRRQRHRDGATTCFFRRPTPEGLIRKVGACGRLSASSSTYAATRLATRSRDAIAMAWNKQTSLVGTAGTGREGQVEQATQKTGSPCMSASIRLQRVGALIVGRPLTFSFNGQDLVLLHRMTRWLPPCSPMASTSSTAVFKYSPRAALSPRPPKEPNAIMCN